MWALKKVNEDNEDEIDATSMASNVGLPAQDSLTKEQGQSLPQNTI